MTPEERFWKKVAKQPSGCWEWRGSTDGRGYGMFSLAGRLVRAHRFAYELLVGPIADGLQIDHLCRVRDCVNPKHMEPVTHRENTLRGDTVTAANAVKTHCLRGHEYSPANTYVDRRGSRHCRKCECERIRRRRYGLAVRTPEEQT